MAVTAVSERAYERNAWTLLIAGTIFSLLVGAAGLFFSASDLSSAGLGGLSWDANSAVAKVTAEFLRTASQWIFFSSIIFAVVAAVPFRRGARWSWYAMWAMPANLVVGLGRNLSLGYTGFWPLWFPIVLVPLVLSVVGLLLPYRKFFPRKP